MPTTEDLVATNGFAANDGNVDDEDGDDSLEHLWNAYVAVNHAFADSIRDNWQDGDQIWIHDYPFLLLPQMLRAALPIAKIGFFFHVITPLQLNTITGVHMDRSV